MISVTCRTLSSELSCVKLKVKPDSADVKSREDVKHSLRDVDIVLYIH